MKQNNTTGFKKNVASVDPIQIRNLPPFPEMRLDPRQVFVIMLGVYRDSAIPELPQIEFTILQTMTQVSTTYSQQIGHRIIDNYSAVLAYNGIPSEEKRRELFQSLIEYFIVNKESVFSLSVQMPAQVQRD